jgi:hypothetical protein
MTFCRCRPGLQGFPDSATDLDRSLGTTALMTLFSPPELSRKSWCPLSVTPPLVRFTPNQCSLPPISLPRVHSQEPKPPSVRRYHPPNPVPPSWFRTTMTVYSAQKSRVCCTPQPAKGSPRFVRPSPSPTRRPSWTPLAVPAKRFTPFEEFPSSEAVPHHCGRCLPVVTDHRPVHPPAEARRRTVHPRPKPRVGDCVPSLRGG